MDVLIGARLRQWRHALGLTQHAMAERIGVHIGVLKKYEQGLNVPGGQALAAIAKTGVNMTWLLTGEGQMLDLVAQEPQSNQWPTPDDQVGRRLAKIGELLDAMPSQEAAALLDEFLSRASTASELAELKRAVAELTASNQRHRKTG